MPHTPIDFPLYGLEDWPGPTWLEHLDGRQGGAVIGVHLAHGTDPRQEARDRWARVSSRPWRDVQAAPGTPQSVADSAFVAMLALRNLLPPREAGSALSPRQIEREAAGADAWPTVTWHVADRAVTASVWHWNGGWAGFTLELSAAVAVAGYRVAADGLRLKELTDTSSYHFDASAPLEFPEAVEASRREAFDLR